MPSDDRYPNGYTHPQNINALGRPPRILQSLNPDVRALLTRPDLLNILQAAVAEGDPDVVELVTDLRQFERAMNGDRVRPGEYNGRNDQPTMPMPFAPQETHRPDRLPGTPQYESTRAAVENVVAAEMTQDLRERMSEPSTWERADPNYGRTSEAERTPSLRDSIRASVDHHEE